jgi:tripartite-type tricarboxylate transporter receptor subunit TctC
MKRLLLVFCVFLFGAAAYAQQTVTVLWPFNIGSNQAAYARAIIDQANTQQTKYRFVLENKPGAGGTIAARMVQGSHEITLLSMSSSFFIRPVFYPNESYNVNNFKPVYVECQGQPLALVSSKFKNIGEIRKQQRVTVGVVLGGMTESVGRELTNHLPGVIVELIPYQGSLQATQDVIGGRLDASVDFAGDVSQWIETGKMFAVGITGTRSFPNYASFKSQGVTGFEELISNYQIIASKSLAPSLTEELHGIFTAAAKDSPILNDLYKRDFCTAANVDMKQSEALFEKWKAYWPKQLLR